MKQENVILTEDKNTTKELNVWATQMIELTDKDIKIVMSIFHIYKKQ